jgi:tetratricopeptide (TPR) repeat protein
MIKKLFVIMFAGAVSASGCYAADLTSLVIRGNEYYSGGEFEKAIELYEAVIDSGYSSAELYFNLGNAYFKTHRITLALLNYERASIINPYDKEVQHNLQLARTFVTDEIEVIPEFILKKWMTSIIRLTRSDSWALISIGSFIVTLLLLLAYLFSRRIMLRKLSFWAAILLILISTISFTFSHQRKKMDTHHHTALILAPSVTVKSSPDDSGTDIFQLHEGTKVTVVDQLGEWREIKIADGNQGWVKNSELIEI